MKSADDVVTKSHLDEKLAELHKRFDDLAQKLDWFMGKYTKFDEEQNLLSGKVADHSDRLEIIEEKLHIQP